VAEPGRCLKKSASQNPEKPPPKKNDDRIPHRHRRPRERSGGKWPVKERARTREHVVLTSGAKGNCKGGKNQCANPGKERTGPKGATKSRLDLYAESCPSSLERREVAPRGGKSQTSEGKTRETVHQGGLHFLRITPPCEKGYKSTTLRER